MKKEFLVKADLDVNNIVWILLMQIARRLFVF